MAELRFRNRDLPTLTAADPEHPVEPDPPERHDRSEVVESSDLSVEPRRTCTLLIGRRPVPGRGTVHCRRHIAAGQSQSVTGRGRFRLIGEAGSVQTPKQPVARSVAGEHPPRAVRSMGGRCEADHQHPGVRVTETGDGSPPVLLVDERCAPFLGDPMSPLHEPGAAAARDQLVVDRIDRRQRAGSNAPSDTFEKGFHNIQPSPYFSAESICARTCSSV